MSRVYFHSPNGTAELSGAERALCGHVVNRIAIGLLYLGDFRHCDLVKSWLPADHYLHTTHVTAFRQSYETAFSVGSGPLILQNGEVIDHWMLALNTAIAFGNDAVRLMARIHGQCEIHGYVSGPNRKWLADIIQQGRDLGIYRTEMGWERVWTLLRRTDESPVVMSYSVCDQFPNPFVAGWMPPWPDGVPEQWDALTPDQQVEREARQDEWYDLPPAQQWQTAWDALQASRGGLELKPGREWAHYRFGHGMTVVDLFP